MNGFPGKRLGTWLMMTLLILVLAAPAALAKQGSMEIKSFRPVTVFNVPGGGVAEIIAATPDGKTVVYTNSGDRNLGIVDISNPLRPVLAAAVSLPGEPTSAAVTPDGKYALTVVNTSLREEGEKPEINPGQLIVIDLETRQAKGSVAVGPGPDSICLGQANGKLMAVIAIENEPIVVDQDGKKLDEDAPGHPGDISAPGLVQIVELDLDNPAASVVRDVVFPEADLRAAGLLFPADPQPEFVDIYQGRAAVTLQENNGVAIIDLATGKVEVLFSTGRVSDRPADLTEDDAISFTQTYPGDVEGKEYAGARFPDALAWNADGTALFTADEGEMNFSGGRGWSVWTPSGDFVWDDGGALEKEAVALGLYPEGRSENKGVEMEGVDTGVFNGREFAFVGSERGSFVAVYDINVPARPRLIQILPVGMAPEGLLAIPQRGLLLTSDEGSGTICIFAACGLPFQAAGVSPVIRSAGSHQPWSALSGLAADPRDPSVLYSVPDNALPSTIYRLDLSGDGQALLSYLAPVTENGAQARFDLEGIVVDTSILAPENPGFWLASEGNAKFGQEDYTPNLLIQVDAQGKVLKKVGLPAEIDSPQSGAIRGNGFEGVAVSSCGRYLLAAIQRDYADDKSGDRKFARIGRYDLQGESWEFFLYPLEKTTTKKDWIGLSDILNLGYEFYAVIERDKQVGGAAKLKAVYVFTLNGLKPFEGLLKEDSATDGAVIEKTLMLDLLSAFTPLEKLEGLAVSSSGVIWAVLDNDGGEVGSMLKAVGYLPDALKALEK